MTPSRPDIYVGVAFNADPFDSNATPTWTDLTSRVYRINSAKRGRQYELDRNQAGALTVDWHNADEALNPVNTGSPFYPNVVPYRQVLARCMWPNGGTGNLFNLAYNGTDPTFESYTAGASVPGVLTAGTGVSATVTTTNPQQGTKCLTYNVVNGGGTSGVGVIVPCIPGRQYTSSLYVRQTAANLTEIFINGGVGGTTTSTTGAYVRLSVTWTATQPTHQLWVASFGTSLSGTVWVDAIQHEAGASMSAFTTTGPLIRNLWTRGYIERWPVGWVDGGFRGISATTGVGPFAILSNATLHTEIRNSIMAKDPDYYWTLQESENATIFAETSGNNGPVLTKTNSPVGAGPTFAPGTSTNVAGDNSGTGVRTAPNAGSEGLLNTPFSCLQLGYTGPTLVGPSAASGSDFNWSCTTAFIMTRPAATINSAVKLLRFTDFSNNSVLGLFPGTPGTITAAGLSGNITDVWGDGKPHLYVMTSTQAAPNFTGTLWIDGVQVATQTSGGFGAGFTMPKLVLSAGGAVTYTFNQSGQDQTVSHIAYWNRALSTFEIADLNNAFKGYPGESTGTRIGRYLGLAGFVAPTNVQTGATTLGVASVKEGDGLLDTCQFVTDCEFGNFYEDINGIAFAGRFDRYLKTSSSYTFGENAAGGEYPYEDDIVYDFDPTLVLNVADLTQANGVVVHYEDPTGASQKRYGRKNFQRNVDTASANEVIDATTWVVANRKDPLLRVAAITFNPASVSGLSAGDGTHWPMILTLEIGTRVTIRRRPKAANGGTGITMSADYFVESIEHHDIDFEAGTWLTTVELSPVNKAQPWILGDAVYGLLGSTTVLGF